MKPEQILGRKEDIKAILAALGIKEGDKPQEPEHNSWFSPREIIKVGVDGGKSRTQDDWIEYFNSRSEVMLSMPDLYHAGKSDNSGLLAALQKDFKESWEVTSTRIFYQPGSLDARVVHYFGSTVVEPVEMGLEIPDYCDGKLVKEVLDDPSGLTFLQAICGSNDKKRVILENLVNLSGKSEDKLMVWTPNQAYRKVVPERSLACGGSMSFLGCGNFISSVGPCCVVQK